MTLSQKSSSVMNYPLCFAPPGMCIRSMPVLNLLQKRCHRPNRSQQHIR